MAKKKTTKTNAAEKRTDDDANTAAELVSEQEKAAAGDTDAQREMREYHEGDFQKYDPISGEERDLDAPRPVARADRGETVETVVRKSQK